MRRIVITGVGAVTPIGFGKEEFWKALEEGKNGVGLITRFDTSLFSTRIGAEVKNFEPENWLSKKEVRRTDLVIQYAVAAADMAVEDAALDLNTLDKERFGVYIGSGEGGMTTLTDGIRTIKERGPSKVSPFFIPMILTNMLPGYIAIRYGAKGPNLSVVTACASSLHNIGEAYNCIRRGDSDVILAGGAEAALIDCTLAGFSAIKALSTRNDDPTHASRPFDVGRDGFVMGEGSGILILEELERALKRGAHIYAEIKGYGLTCDAFHITAPDEQGDGAYRAMAMAVKKTGWRPEQIDLINAHGTSTQLNDKMESVAIERLLSKHTQRVMVQGTKSMTGHMLGASGAVEVIAALLAIEKGIVHPTINIKEKDPCCHFNIVPNKAVIAKVDRVLVNNFGFGGHNGVIALERYEK